MQEFKIARKECIPWQFQRYLIISPDRAHLKTNGLMGCTEINENDHIWRMVFAETNKLKRIFVFSQTP